MSESEEELDTINWWLDFFADAGIPPNAAAQFAVNFSEHRIPKEREIINDLSNEEWKELGVELLGDRLALKTFAKNGKKKKLRSKVSRASRTGSRKTAEVPTETAEDQISKMITAAKEIAKPIERQNVGNERVKSENPFRKSKNNPTSFATLARHNLDEDQDEDEEEEEDDGVYVSEMTELADSDSVSPVQFSVTLGGSRKRVLDTTREQGGTSSVASPKITRTFGSVANVQENVVSSTAKVNVTFGSKKITIGGKEEAVAAGPKVSCSSFGTFSKTSKNFETSKNSKTSSNMRSLTARVKAPPAEVSAKSRLGNRSVKARLGNH